MLWFEIADQKHIICYGLFPPQKKNSYDDILTRNALVCGGEALDLDKDIRVGPT